MVLTLCPVTLATEEAEVPTAEVTPTQEETVLPAEETEAPLKEVKPAAESVPALTAGATYTGTLGANVTWTLDRETGALTISGTGAMTNYSSESSPLRNYRSYIKTAVIESGVTTVGNYVFYGCTNLTRVTIPAGVTRIENYAFYNCSSLASVSLPDSVTSIGSHAFSSCSSLTSVTIPDSVITIGSYAFYQCSSLTSIHIPTGVTSISSWTFYACNKLTRVDITDLAAWCAISFGGDYANPLFYAKTFT